MQIYCFLHRLKKTKLAIGVIHSMRLHVTTRVHRIDLLSKALFSLNVAFLWEQLVLFSVELFFHNSMHFGRSQTFDVASSLCR